MWLIKTNISKTYRIKNDRFWLFYLGEGKGIRVGFILFYPAQTKDFL
jgi:hypothetical protein